LKILALLCSIAFLTACARLDNYGQSDRSENLRAAGLKRSVQIVTFIRSQAENDYIATGASPVKGLSLKLFLQSLQRRQIDSLLIKAGGADAYGQGMKIQQALSGRLTESVKVVPVRMPKDRDEYLTLELYRFGVVLPDCFSRSGRYIAGCAVQANRALGLVNKSELEMGRALGRSPAVFDAIYVPGAPPPPLLPRRGNE